MTTGRILIASMFFLVVGGLIGTLVTRGYYTRLAQERECDSLSFTVLNSLPVLAHLASNDNPGAQRIIEINLPLQIESLRAIAKERNQRATVAQETLKRVQSWRTEHSNLALSSRLQKAIEP